MSPITYEAPINQVLVAMQAMLDPAAAKFVDTATPPVPRLAQVKIESAPNLPEGYPAASLTSGDITDQNGDVASVIHLTLMTLLDDEELSTLEANELAYQLKRFLAQRAEMFVSGMTLRQVIETAKESGQLMDAEDNVLGSVTYLLLTITPEWLER